MSTRNISRLDKPLVLIVLLSAFLNGFNIWTDQYANSYYTTAVGSMMQSFHNFFYASLDSAGSVTVDKPPVTFWLQTISAEIFGLHGWSVILPQALAGIGSVLLMYFLIKPRFGRTAARLAALTMATTPVAVAVSRTNNIDSMLVFTLLLATWLLFRGIKKNSVWALIGAFAVVGVGFNMKMLQAYMVLPAFYLIYLLAVKMKWKKKASVLVGATAVLIAVSLSWAIIVDLTPEDQRPYIGSSETNSVLELAFGYNGMSRLLGQDGGMQPGGEAGEGFPSNPGQNPSDVGDRSSDSDQGVMNGPPSNIEGVGNPGGAGMMPGGNSGGMFGTGEKGPLRLFQSGLSGQASWLLPFALLASIGLLSGLRLREMSPKHQETLFWLAWLIPVGVFFSIAGFFHHYYLIMLAPPIAALVGAGAVELFQSYRTSEGWKTWLLPSSILVTAIVQSVILHHYNSEIGSGWSWTILLLGIGATLFLVMMKVQKVGSRFYPGILMAILFIGPLYWASTPIVYGGNSMLPQAGPTASGGMGPPGNLPGQKDGADVAQGSLPSGMEMVGELPEGMKGGKGGLMGAGMTPETIDETTYSYLKENNTGETYLFATMNYNTAAPYIIEENESIITMGGFSSNDPVYSIDEMKELIESGKVKYFFVSEGRMGGSNAELLDWIKENGELIPDEEWKNSSEEDDNMSSNPMGAFGGSESLYKVILTNGGGSNE
ncbi:MAG: glycosyltransferase family 39 protein [Anaerobacillus sp.]